MAGSRFFPKIQTTTTPLLSSPSPAHPPTSTGDPLRASVGPMLSRAHNLPCSTAAQSFAQLVQPTSRFQLALDALLPLLNYPNELAQRILVSFILYSLYAPHPISINPFKSALFATYLKEREQAVQTSSGGGSSENEQLVWVLWKILKGDGNDIGPYSPLTLARSPLPPELRASNLTLDEEVFIMEPTTDILAIEHKEQEGDHRYSNGKEAYEQNITHPSTSHVSLEHKITPEEDDKNERIARSMKLLLAARDRVLTLSEQRILTPLIPQLTSPPMITSMDLPSIVSNNPNIAYPLYIALLSLSPSELTSQGLSLYLDVLKYLPPTLPSFDLLGRLLRDSTSITDTSTGGQTTIADLIRIEVLGRFIHESINWLDNAEREEKEGFISDDRFAKGVQHLCRFYNSLLKGGMVDASSDADSTEMAHFTLRNARFEEANALYRILAIGKF
ncbi:hypothetical protein SERLADRAFT_380864 [Serpula lacrymans var. lacrymans S7.9]|uniref:Uncharacterized protein n=1 Tax=Serpula lacrymans var. lacrymans (strain S7.9) TaxID=578457 RepID=F8NKJ6_SERL9|nr:uncharacterized protein SERLADRAFT_380864 [Serpula lacrymans var. lacrymans S7.9]EGO28769.1 hypothetical protein SERLADRAFT_380864 [Serpula lacrymans var. lacrymans S7.9]